MLRCPYCGKMQTKVVGKYKHPSWDTVKEKRYRKCLECGRSFKTIEEVADKETNIGQGYIV